MKIKMIMKSMIVLVILVFVWQMSAQIALATTVSTATESLTTGSTATGSVTTEKYEVRDGVIMRIAAGTTASQFLTNITVASGDTKEVYSGSTQVTGSKRLTTGMTLKVGKSATYKIAVRGDASGDGMLTAMDLSQFKLNFAGTKALASPNIEAVDINYDGQVTALDLSQLKMLIVGLDI